MAFATRKDTLLQHATATPPTDANKHTTHKQAVAMDVLPALQALLVEVMVTDAHLHASVVASVIPSAFTLLHLLKNVNESTAKS